MSTPDGHCLFDTPLGRFGVAWTSRGISSVVFPASEEAMRARLMRHGGPRAGEPDDNAADAVARLTELLSTGTADLTPIRLDETRASAFEWRVYGLTRAIAPGQTRSYGEIARDLGDAGAARAVGVAMGRNPYPLIVPCHRVLAANGKPGGFSAPGGLATKRRLLHLEGVSLGQGPTLFEHFGL